MKLYLAIRGVLHHKALFSDATPSEYFIKQGSESKFWVYKWKYLQWKQESKTQTQTASKYSLGLT